MAKVKFAGLQMDSVGAMLAESGVVDATLNLDAAYLDFDPTGIGYARVGAKRNGAGTSAGLKLRTLNAGAFVDAVTYAADGTPTFAKGPQITAGITALQAVTATSVTVSGGTFGAGTLYKDPTTDGLVLALATGGTYDLAIYNPAGTAYVLRVPHGTSNVVLPNGSLTVANGITLSAGEVVINSVNGEALRFVSAASGTYGKPTYMQWWRSDNITARGYMGFGAENDPRLTIATEDAAGFIVFGTGTGGEVGRMTATGTLAWGTTVVSGAGAGDIVIANGAAVRGLNGGGSAAAMLGRNAATGNVVIGGQTDTIDSGDLVRGAYWSAVNLPPGNANKNGVTAVDGTNTRFVFYSGGARYYIPGTAF